MAGDKATSSNPKLAKTKYAVLDFSNQELLAKARTAGTFSYDRKKLMTIMNCNFQQANTWAFVLEQHDAQKAAQPRKS